MASWLQVANGATGTALLNPEYITRMVVSGSDPSWTVTIYQLQANDGEATYTLPGSPFTTSADAVTAMQAAIPDGSSVNLTVSGTL